MGGVEVCPGVDDGDDFDRGQVGESTVVGWGKGNNVTFPRDRLCMKELGG